MKLTTKQITIIGMLGAIAVVLMLFEIPLPFAPSFYEIDLSEVPVIIGTFVLGPISGVLIELVKILLNLLLNGTVTAGVGELSNFVLGCMFCVPAGIVYKKWKTRKGAVAGLITGTLVMSVSGCFINAYIMLPTYAKAFKIPIDVLVEMGTAVNASITDLFSFVMFAVLPFNLLKGTLVSVVVLLIYKKISSLLKKL